ncbi:MAG: hypothetical protein E5Y01_21235 [Mesorhizobium sp.]|nr:MAG: hypothetical protein EOR75_28965 [Mesorhizobium sp.]TJV49945.1 MAG: hypothetical protein E5Y01_21235 [Mesorhizobium sp.]
MRPAGQHPPSGLPAISPARGEIGSHAGFPNLQSRRMSRAPKLLISPLAGEMPGRAEGGVKDRDASMLSSWTTIVPAHHPVPIRGPA